MCVKAELKNTPWWWDVVLVADTLSVQVNVNQTGISELANRHDDVLA